MKEDFSPSRPTRKKRAIWCSGRESERERNPDLGKMYRSGDFQDFENNSGVY